MGVVLCRKVGQRLSIGPEISVLVTSVRGRQVHLNIDAPVDIQIDRPEVVVNRPKQSTDRVCLMYLIDVVEKVLADEETGTGWGPDVTTANLLREALTQVRARNIDPATVGI